MKTQRITSILFAVTLLLGGCERGELSGQDIDDIRQVVFLYQFEHNASGLDEVGALCLSLGQRSRDPTAEFLTRFAGMSPPVLKSTDCAMNQSRSDHGLMQQSRLSSMSTTGHTGRGAKGATAADGSLMRRAAAIA